MDIVFNEALGILDVLILNISVCKCISSTGKIKHLIVGHLDRDQVPLRMDAQTDGL